MISMFGYKSGPSGAKNPAPHKIHDNIIGIELEFNNCIEKNCEDCYCEDCDFCDEEGARKMEDKVYNAFERLIDQGIIINPNNMSKIKYDHNAVLERDGSVDGEIILQADYQKNIMETINKINKELNSSVLNNTNNTSCHIHRNVFYLNKIGMTKFDYQKATEFLAGILFRISGRDKYSYSRWCQSVFERNIDISYVSMLSMARYIDNMDRLVNGKYLLCNCDHSNTVETRIFSNFHNFDPKFVKLYMDFTNLAMDIGKYMRHKSYVNEFDNLVDYINDFCNETHRRRRILKQFNLDDYIVKKNEVKFVEFKGKWSKIYNEIEDVSQSRYMSYNDQIMHIIRIIRNNNLRLNTTMSLTNRPNYEDIMSALNNQYDNELRDL